MEGREAILKVHLQNSKLEDGSGVKEIAQLTAGTSGNNGVIAVAAANRKDTTDDILLRPGRFDRDVQVDLKRVPGGGQELFYS